MEQKSWDLDSFWNPASSPDGLQNVWLLILVDFRFTWISWPGFFSNANPLPCLSCFVLFCQEALPQQVQLEARFQHIAEMLEADDSKPLSSVFLQDEGWHKWARFETTWMFLKIMVPANHYPFWWIFHYKPSIWGYPYFWKYPHGWTWGWRSKDLHPKGITWNLRIHPWKKKQKHPSNSPFFRFYVHLRVFFFSSQIVEVTSTPYTTFNLIFFSNFTVHAGAGPLFF